MCCVGSLPVKLADLTPLARIPISSPARTRADFSRIRDLRPPHEGIYEFQLGNLERPTSGVTQRIAGYRGQMLANPQPEG